MDPRERLRKRFLQLGKSYFRATPEEAEALASVVAESHSTLGALCQFSQAPTARPAELSCAIFLRYLRLGPRLLTIVPVISRKAICAEAFAPIGEPCLSGIYAVSEAIGTEQL